MTEPILVQAISSIGLIVVAGLQWLAARREKARDKANEKRDEVLAKVREDAAVARAQTENAHAEADYPNLRDELTAVREGQERGFDRVERYMRDVDRSARATAHSLDRHIEDAERSLRDGEARLDRIEGELSRD